MTRRGGAAPARWTTASAAPAASSSLPSVCAPEPDRLGGRLDRTIDRRLQVGCDDLDRDLVAETLGECGRRAVAHDARPIEPPVHGTLDAAAEGLEQGKRGEGRCSDGERLVPGDAREESL